MYNGCCLDELLQRSTVFSLVYIMRKTPSAGIAAQIFARRKEYLPVQFTPEGLEWRTVGRRPRVPSVCSPQCSLSADPSHTWSFLLPGGCRLWCAGFSSAPPHPRPVPAPAPRAGSWSLESTEEENLGTIVLPHSLFYYS